MRVSTGANSGCSGGQRRAITNRPRIANPPHKGAFRPYNDRR